MNKNFTSRTTGKNPHSNPIGIKMVLLSLLVLCIHTFLPWFFQLIPAIITFIFWQLHFSYNIRNNNFKTIPIHTSSKPAPEAGIKA